MTELLTTECQKKQGPLSPTHSTSREVKKCVSDLAVSAMSQNIQFLMSSIIFNSSNYFQPDRPPRATTQTEHPKTVSLEKEKQSTLSNYYA